MNQERKDLIALVADSNMEATLRGILERPQALGIQPITFDIRVHPERDPGVYNEAHNFLRPFTDYYAYTLVMFDREGCGQRRETNQLRQEVQNRLNAAGWQRRSEVIVLDPELEIWVWSDSPHVASVLGLRTNELDDVLRRFGSSPRGKPNPPKEAMEEALRRSRIPRSSSLYYELAQKVSLHRCTDRSFIQLRQTLRQWFAQKG